MRCQLGLDPIAQGLEPFHFVFKLVAARRLAVGEIRTNHAYTLHRTSDDPRQLVFKTGDVFHHIASLGLGQQGHAVVGFLPKPLRLVTRLRKGIVGKFIVGEFGLLQGQHIDWVGAQPIEHLGQAHG